MSRQPVDGVAFRDMPWQSTSVLWGPDSAAPAALEFTGHGMARVLSHDPDTGALSLLIKEPPGWHTAAAESHSVFQEDILLEGDCWYGETHYEGPTYFAFPAGHEHGPMFTETGALWLVTLSGPFDVSYSDEIRAENMSWFERARR
jgi:hypothetical protein